MNRRVGRRTIKLSNLDKPIYPSDGITKGDVIDYYEAVSERMLGLIRGRMMSFERYPDGVDSYRFFQKDTPRHYPEWIARKSVPKEGGGTVAHVVPTEKAVFVYLANQACLTWHASLSRREKPDRPDVLIFDLDPSSDGQFPIVRRTALRFREVLEDLGLFSVAMTTGSRGLHIVAPLDARTEFDSVRAFSRDLAVYMTSMDPHDLTVEHRKTKREGRVFVDWMRNAFSQTAVAPYSLRARPGAPAAVPLDWDELKSSRLRPDGFKFKAAVERAGGDDPWSGWRRRARGLAGPRKRLDALIKER